MAAKVKGLKPPGDALHQGGAEPVRSHPLDTPRIIGGEHEDRAGHPRALLATGPGRVGIGIFDNLNRHSEWGIALRYIEATFV